MRAGPDSQAMAAAASFDVAAAARSSSGASLSAAYHCVVRPLAACVAEAGASSLLMVLQLLAGRSQAVSSLDSNCPFQVQPSLPSSPPAVDQALGSAAASIPARPYCS